MTTSRPVVAHRCESLRITRFLASLPVTPAARPGVGGQELPTPEGRPSTPLASIEDGGRFLVRASRIDLPRTREGSEGGIGLVLDRPTRRIPADHPIRMTRPRIHPQDAMSAKDSGVLNTTSRDRK